MYITEDVKYIGVNDHSTDLFEGQFDVPDGIAYNSYVIKDEKIAVTDTADKNFKDEWFSNLEKVLDGKEPDYLIVHHMEPDHSANIDAFLEKYPSAQVVSTIKAFNMMEEFKITQLAVMREGRYCGMIHIHDILREGVV